MSRRNSSNRRRSYGRRLHEMHERRGQRPATDGDWLADLDAGEGTWQPSGGSLPLDGAALHDSRGRAA